MSLTHSLCLVIILLCQYVSLEISAPSELEEDKEENETQSMDENPEEANIPARFNWPQGIVPFYIDKESYDEIIANRIRSAMRLIESVSCVIFREISESPEQLQDFHCLIIKNPKMERDCVHHTLLGDVGKANLILGYDCMKHRDIIHALLHVLGFGDEVTHPQRDKYIRILWPNIQPKYRPLFWPRPDDLPYYPMVEYDTMSIMHFHDRAYSVNGRATVAPLIPGLLINPTDKLSQLDIMKLQLAYGHECNKRKVSNLMETCHNTLQKTGMQSSGENSESQSEFGTETELESKPGSGDNKGGFNSTVPRLCEPSMSDMIKGGWMNEMKPESATDHNGTWLQYSCWVATDINTAMIKDNELPRPGAAGGAGEGELVPRFIDITVPGTKWCGPGNTSNYDDELGGYREADMCCRDHDHCPDLIPGGEFSPRFNLTNPTYFTKLSCECDDAFRVCLKSVEGDFWTVYLAKWLGRFYFRQFPSPSQCFKKDYPRTCIKKTKWGSCVEYFIDIHAEKIYQWFDLEGY